MKLFVAGLPSDFDDVDLKEMFELYGEVRSAKIVMDRATGKTKGFGFVDMANKAEALETIEALDGAGLPRGKKIVVKEAEEQQRPGGSSNSGFNRNSGSSGGGFNRNSSGGSGYNRNNEGGGYNRNSSGGGYNRNNNSGYNRNSDSNDDNRFNR
jgi:RNA recognition motif-containing protein